VLQALPLAIALFVLVPRIAPLWNMQLDSGQARTGMSDSMSPGQVSRLTESSELAFRVQFEGEPPPPRERYWRGLTYSYFDGTTWRQASPPGWDREQLFYGGRGPSPDWYRALINAAADRTGYRYRVIMEPSRQRWLYALAVPFTDFDGNALARDFRLVADGPVNGAFSYTVRSVDVTGAVPALGDAERRLMLDLPEEGNAQARALAQRWRQRHRNDGALVQAALGYFREQPFFYTLEPPRIAGDTVDEFLFGTRQGFCEHYASSFTFLMRAAGIPARVVAGYQGGEMNAGDYLQVRQYDAHAWAEVWLPGQGWVQVDPTAAVAPERVELGLRGAFDSAADGAGGDFDGLNRLPVLFQLQQWADYVDFNWQKWVLGYRQQSQRDLLERLLGAVTPLRVGLALLGVVLVFSAVLGLLVLSRRRDTPVSPLEREFARLHRALAQRGLRAPDTVSAAQLEAAVTRRWPSAAGAAGHWRRLFEHLAYRDQGAPGAADLAALRRRRRAVLASLASLASPRRAQ
jgi:transglutaminase-like putative cysteine protease